MTQLPHLLAPEAVVHTLAGVAVVRDAWTGRPLTAAVAVVASDDTWAAARTPPGVSCFADGSYRFIGSPDDNATFEVSDPAGRWTFAQLDAPPSPSGLGASVAYAEFAAFPTPKGPQPNLGGAVQGQVWQAGGDAPVPFTTGRVRIRKQEPSPPDPPEPAEVPPLVDAPFVPLDAEGEFVAAFAGGLREDAGEGLARVWIDIADGMSIEKINGVDPTVVDGLCRVDVPISPPTYLSIEISEP